MAAFFVGDVVEARVTAQGMVKGERYLVVDAISEPTIVPGGTYTTFVLQRGDDRVRVINLHVLAVKVETKKLKMRVLKPKWNPDDEQWEVVVKINGPHGKTSGHTMMRWATDAAHGEVAAKSVDHAIELLVADGEWATGEQERRDIADGAWLRIDGRLVRGEV